MKYLQHVEVKREEWKRIWEEHAPQSPYVVERWPVLRFEAFTPEAKDAYPVPPTEMVVRRLKAPQAKSKRTKKR